MGNTPPPSTIPGAKSPVLLGVKHAVRVCLFLFYRFVLGEDYKHDKDTCAAPGAALKHVQCNW